MSEPHKLFKWDIKPAVLYRYLKNFELTRYNFEMVLEYEVRNKEVF